MKKIIITFLVSVFLLVGVGNLGVYAACPANQIDLGCAGSIGNGDQCGLTHRGCKRTDGSLNCVSDVSCKVPAAAGVGVKPANGGGASPINGSCGSGSIDTAIGCIPFGDQNALIGFFLRWGIGIGGGIAFLLILIAGFQIMTSRGDPKKLQAGQELMTSAISGLLLLIFSLVILRIIGLDVLGIKFFG